MKRQEKNDARREAILDAALELFSDTGFAAARVEDIARKAGVAKGTIYLYFKDKQGLLDGLVEAVISPMHQRAREIIVRSDLTLREKLWRTAQPLLEDNGNSRVACVIRLMHAEGLHNPQLVRVYQETILTTVLTLHKENICDAEGIPQALRDFPQLLMAPLIHGICWQRLFGQSTALDLAGMFKAYLDLLFGKEEGNKDQLFSNADAAQQPAHPDVRPCARWPRSHCAATRLPECADDATKP